MVNKVYLFRFVFRGIEYLYTNQNSDLTNQDVASFTFDFNKNDVFKSANIDVVDGLGLNPSIGNTPIKVSIDKIPPITLLTSADSLIDLEIYEKNDSFLKMKWKGQVSKSELDTTYILECSGPKLYFSNPLPILNITPICQWQTYSEQCGVNRNNHKQDIYIVTTVDRTVVINPLNLNSLRNREALCRNNSLALPFTDGFFVCNDIYYSIVEQVNRNYAAAQFGATNKLRITSFDDFYVGTKIELQYLTTSTYCSIISIDNSSSSTKVATIDASSVGATLMTVRYITTKDNIPVTGNATMYEGDNHSLATCNIKFNNEGRICAFQNVKNINPVISNPTA